MHYTLISEWKTDYFHKIDFSFSSFEDDSDNSRKIDYCLTEIDYFKPKNLKGNNKLMIKQPHNISGETQANFFMEGWQWPRGVTNSREWT